MSESHQPKSPAFQFYPKDFLSDSHVVGMRLPERGAYITLLCFCWLDGSIPSDLDLLARYCQVSTAVFTRLWPALEPCFRASDLPGRLYHPRVERERRKQETYRAYKADAGQKGGRAKADSKQTPGRDLADGKQTPSRDPSRSLAKASPPSSSSSSSPEEYKDYAAPAANVSVSYSPPPGLHVTDAIAEKAGAFLRRYPEIYAEERKGAHFRILPVKHYPTACELVAGWPDLARLELMLRTFLRLDDPMSRPGTPAQLLHLAPAIDARLRDVGSYPAPTMPLESRGGTL